MVWGPGTQVASHRSAGTASPAVAAIEVVAERGYQFLVGGKGARPVHRVRPDGLEAIAQPTKRPLPYGLGGIPW